MRTKKGIVTSAKMKNSIIVTVHHSVMHPVYRKRFRRSAKFMADTAGQDVAEGDTVVIEECRPLSKRKCFKVQEVLERAPRVSEMVEEKAVEEAMHREKGAPVVEKKEEKKPAETSADKPAETESKEAAAETSESDSPDTAES